MPVQIQSDMIVSTFWQDVKRHLEQELFARNLASWTVVIRPHTQADDEFSDNPAKFNRHPRRLAGWIIRQSYITSTRRI
jgi:hypothetical protein